MFWGRFIELCNRNKVYPNTVCTQLGFSKATATKWKSGAAPRDTTLKRIADYFGVTVDYLIGQNQQQEAEQPETDAAPIQTAYDNAPPEIQAAVRKLLDL